MIELRGHVSETRRCGCSPIAGPTRLPSAMIAEAAGVSPALVLRHYGSKDGLRDAVDDHVTRVFETLLTEVTQPAGADPFDPAAARSLAELVAARLPADSAVPAYLGWMLVAGGPAGSALFRRLYLVSQETLAGLVAAGSVGTGTDPDVRAAFLLLNDLAVLILRSRLIDVLGLDVLSTDGMKRWAAEVLSIYRTGLGGPSAPS